MTAPTLSADAQLAADIAEEAGRLLLEVRSGDLTGKELGKEGDRLSNALILERLAADRPADAVLSEEAVDDKARLDADRVWIVDPLDGTREFGMPGRNDWAVHVALWARGRGITAAAVAQPSLDAVYVTGHTPHPPEMPDGRPPIMLVSDSRPPGFAAQVADAIGAEVRPMGSAGAKAMAVLRGEADVYLHAGGQWEWDSAAPVGVVLSAGLHASRLDGSELLYNEAHPYLPDLVICRSHLAAPLLAALEGIEAG